MSEGNTSDRSHNPGGSGPIKGGDHSMLNGDIAEGANQENRIVIREKTYLGRGRGYVFPSERGFRYGVYVNGRLAANNIVSDIHVKDYRKMFSNDRIVVLGMNIKPTAIAVPITVRTRNYAPLDGVVTAYMVCNPEFHEGISDLLNGDYATLTRYADTESRRTIYANDLRKIIQNTLADTVMIPASEVDTPLNYLESLTARILDANRRNGVFAMRGLGVVSIELRLAESKEEATLRSLNELDIRRRLETMGVKVDGEINALKMDFILNEYEQMNRGH